MIAGFWMAIDLLVAIVLFMLGEAKSHRSSSVVLIFSLSLSLFPFLSLEQTARRGGLGTAVKSAVAAEARREAMRCRIVSCEQGMTRKELYMYIWLHLRDKRQKSMACRYLSWSRAVAGAARRKKREMSQGSIDGGSAVR